MMKKPVSTLRSLLFLAMLVGSAATMRAGVIVWTLHDVKLTGIFGTVAVTGTFETGSATPASNITAAEQTNPVLYTYTFSGPVNGSDYSNKPSQQPPTLCILAGCNPFGGPVPGSPEPVSLHLYSPFGPGLGPFFLSASFEDDLELYSGSGTITGAAQGPEPATWVLLAFGLAAMAACTPLRRGSYFDFVRKNFR